VLPQASALQKEAFLGNGTGYTLSHAQFPTHSLLSAVLALLECHVTRTWIMYLIEMVGKGCAQ